MIRNVIYLVVDSRGLSEAGRIARIANRLTEMGVVVTQRNNIDLETTPDPQHKRLLHVVTTLGVLGSRMFDITDIKLEMLKPQQIDNYKFPALRKQHTVRARQEIKRLSLNPRVLKHPRGNFRCR